MLKQGFRFSKTNRLQQAAEYQNVFERPVKAADKYFTVLAKLNSGHEPRLGLAISKKNVRHAVARNRLKRLVRESFRNHKTELMKLDVVVLAKTAATNVDNLTLLNSLSVHWKTLNRKFSMSSDS